MLSSVFVAAVASLLGHAVTVTGMEFYPEAEKGYTREGNSPNCVMKADNGNCLEETHYMMLHCVFDCVGTMRNTNPSCNKWAEEKVIEFNISYIHILYQIYIFI
jgi:hypothetical protein